MASDGRGGRRRWGAWVVALLLPAPLAWGAPLRAQAWNDDATREVVARAVAARRQAEPDSSLTSYQSRAHGFVLFLAQAGRDLDQPPRLIKADELDVAVYWQAPSRSRQVILGWRDGRWLPTDINYHRDHLGIVTNNFGDQIRIGEGDEVRDVVHPLAPSGPELYDYRLVDSIRLATRAGVLLLHEVAVRPRDPGRPLVVGTLSLDAATGDLVRFRFSFTPSAYLDSSLEDLSVVLENARLEGRWWLPWRQEVEIRRRLVWLDFPMRSIIRGRWEIGDYALNAGMPDTVRGAPAIGGLRAPGDSARPWSAPLADLVREEARPVERQDVDALRGEVERMTGGRLRSGLPSARPGLTSVSDLVRVNRVQGLALGAGAAFFPVPALAIRPRVAIGTSDRRFLGDLSLTAGQGRGVVALAGGRRLRDLPDEPIVSGLVNSLLAQEGGRDLGDWALVDFASLSLSRNIGATARIALEGGVERSRSVKVAATPATGGYRPNPPLGAGTIGVGRFTATRLRRSADGSRGFDLTLRLEGGTGDRDYLRVAPRTSLLVPAGPGGVLLRVEAGLGTSELPPGRSFAFGGWGTLPGEPFRAYGGRRMLVGALEYRFEVPFPAVPLGAFASTGRRITLAPFLAAGWAGGRVAGVPWQPGAGGRPVAGMALEWFHHLIRVETGVSLSTGHVGVSVDLARDWWEIL